MEELKKIDGVVAAAPFIYYKAAVQSKNSGDGIVVRGIDPAMENNITGLEKQIVIGQYDLSPYEENTGAILVGKTLAQRLDVVTGDELLMYSLQGEKLRANAQPRVKKFIVRGIAYCKFTLSQLSCHPLAGTNRIRI
jgi:lipoprotein-releasing system permease protein